MKKYYAANNAYGSETDFGFANTWCVLVFDSKCARDQYVDESDKVSATKITRDEIKNYVDAPKPFSGKKRVIVHDESHENINGCIGEVVLDYDGLPL